LPIRVELAPLSRDDLRRILTEPEHSLLKQYTALMGTEKVTLTFTDDAVDALAELAADINDRVENIGARRLHTVLERLLEEISFTATDKAGEVITVDAAYVNEKVAPLAQRGDLSRFILYGAWSGAYRVPRHADGGRHDGVILADPNRGRIDPARSGRPDPADLEERPKVSSEDAEATRRELAELKRRAMRRTG